MPEHGIGSRIREIRLSLPGKVTQKEFGESLGVSTAVITAYELGHNTPPPATIKLICSTYGINEYWLKTGEGDRKIERAVSLEEEIRDIMRGEQPFKAAIMTALAAMPDSFWNEWAKRLDDELKKQGWHD